MLGVVVMVIDAEITGQTLFGITKLDLVDCGADDWRVVVTTDRALQFCTEFVLCAICPLPGTGSLHWSFIETNRNMQATHGRSFHVRELFCDLLKWNEKLWIPKIGWSIDRMRDNPGDEEPKDLYFKRG
ncbi:unnamed protein product [Strongylus vulgaris]|uniref:Uncharacterized protein n=1 Tax=Strongylus vulgaris TaxID=40348 RepID=A0A3P7LRH5_STRVU|nr:unnamed protein product [Strongylus vulgaris]